MLGTPIGNYTVTEKIGEGGQGTVYLAEHAVLGRRAAVKVLLPQLSNQRDVIARFFNEARAATAIRHPSIVEVYDVGYLPDASAYIVMEFLAGETLASRAHRLGRLEPARALALVRQIAGALAAAHDCGIVHRDLKPDNVFIVPDPEVAGGERIKILDFGIAKLAGDAGGATRTQTGTVLGTPTYIAPEQCRGAGQVDARADLYALGCVLYELVCGQPPFVMEGAGELIAHHLYFEPPAPRSVEPGVPESVERLILRLLRKDPGARPQSARELVEAIDRLELRADPATGPVVRAEAPVAPYASATLPAHSTTLSAATGFAARPSAAAARRRPWLTAAVAVATLAGGIGVYAAATAGRGDRTVHVTAPLSAAAPAAAPASLQASVPAPASPQAPVPAPASPQAPASAPAPAPAPAAVAPAPASLPAPAVAPPQAAPPVAHSVHLRLDSDPTGATVSIGGTPVGTTPLDDRVAAGSPARAYTIRKDGYEPATATLDTAHDAARQVVLKKLRPSPRPAPPPSLGDKGINPFDH